MKTSSSVLMLIAAISPAAFLQTGCSKNDATASDTAQNASPATANVAATTAISDTWDRVKDFTYEKRVEFTASFDRMTTKMDDKTREMKAKIANLPDNATKDREHAMNDFAEARTDLKSKLTDLGNATADTWVSAKDKVGQAWQKANAAFDKAMSSSTPTVVSN